jgi:hypothetical protein
MDDYMNAIGSGDPRPCAYSEALVTLLALVGRVVDLSVRAESVSTRQLVFASGPLRAGPELGSEPDALIPVSVGDVELALKEAWIERAWKDGTDTSLALLFAGGLLVELDLAHH